MLTEVQDCKVVGVTFNLSYTEFNGDIKYIKVSVAEYIFINKMYPHKSFDYYILRVIGDLRRNDPTSFMLTPGMEEVWTQACSIQQRMLDTINSMGDRWVNSY